MNGREPSLNKNDTDCRGSIDDLVHMAERELAAFVGAVNELFGSEEARISTAEWIEELLAADRPIGPDITDWRRITIIASSRLANRVCRNAESTSVIRATMRRPSPHESKQCD